MTTETFEMRRVRKEELDDMCEFYWQLCDELADTEYSPAWQREIYPAREDLAALVAAGELYVHEEDGEMIAAVAVNRSFNEGYADVAWSSGVPDEDAIIVHLLCVAAGHQGRGLSHRIVEFCIALAREWDARAVRLDVLVGNLPAARLYEGHGFEFVERRTLFYEDTGWTDFDLYELALG